MIPVAAIEAVQAMCTAEESVSLSLCRGQKIQSLDITRTGRRVSAEKRSLLYSVTKTMMAAGALHLVQAGRLELDRTLETWLPEFKPAAKITLRQILQHTSGLPDYDGVAKYHAAVRRGDRPWSEDEFLKRTHAARLLFAPGSSFAYSNIGYMLLRRILARASGLSLSKLLQRAIFHPIGISDAMLVTTKSALSHLNFGASPYLGEEGEPKNVAAHYHPQWVASGVVSASAASMARFLHALFRGELICLELVHEMTKGWPVTLATDSVWKRPAYGLGLMMELNKSRGPAFGHLGDGPGCTPAVLHFPSKRPRLTIGVMTTAEDVDQAFAMIMAVSKVFPNSTTKLF